MAQGLLIYPVKVIKVNGQRDMKKIKATNLFLNLDQISVYCGTPLKRVNNWVEKKGLPMTVDNGVRKVSHADLIDFLVKHNMPIPEAIIPAKVKKILFVFSQELIMDEIVLNFLMKFFEKLKTESDLIVDYCSYGTMVNMKLLVFKPDLVILDVGSADDSCELCALIKCSDDFENIKVAAIVEKSKINADLKKRLCADALLPRCVDLKTLMEHINEIFSKG